MVGNDKILMVANHRLLCPVERPGSHHLAVYNRKFVVHQVAEIRVVPHLVEGGVTIWLTSIKTLDNNQVQIENFLWSRVSDVPF